MEVSKLSVSQETHSRLNAMAHISPKRKRQIRVEGIKRLIDSKHSGYKFTAKELMSAAGYRPEMSKHNYWNAASFLADLRSKGELIKLSESPRARRASYYLRTPEELSAHKLKKIQDEERALAESKPHRGRPPKNTNKVEELDIAKINEFDKAVPEIASPDLDIEIDDIDIQKDSYIPFIEERKSEAAAAADGYAPKQDSEELYSFEFVVTKRGEQNFGRLSVANLGMSDVNTRTIQHMVNEIIERI